MYGIGISTVFVLSVVVREIPFLHDWEIMEKAHCHEWLTVVCNNWSTFCRIMCKIV